MSLAAKRVLQFLSHLNAATNNDYVDIVAGTFKKDVAHITAHDIALHAQPISRIAYLVEYFLI